VYRGHASASAGLVSPANKPWFNAKLSPEVFQPGEAAKRLADAGFKLQGNVLSDAAGHAVEFSIITNSGSKTRERMAAMIQQDLAKLGIKINIVTLEFPSLIERITRTLDYETCLLGLVNIDIDPSGLMNVLLSSAGNHPWNPSQKTPATVWEAEIDRLKLRLDDLEECESEQIPSVKTRQRTLASRRASNRQIIRLARSWCTSHRSIAAVASATSSGGTHNRRAGEKSPF